MMKMRRSTIILFGLILASAVLLGTIAVPNMFGILALSAHVKEEYKRIGEIVRYAASYQENIRNLAYVEGEIKKFEIPEEGDSGEIKLLQTIERVARETNTPLTLHLKESKDKGSGREVTLEMQLRASYRNILGFLIKIDELPYIVLIDSVTMRSTDRTLAEGAFPIDVTLHGKVQFMKPF